MPSYEVTIVAAGTPQSLGGVASPAHPTISIQGVTSSIGGAQQFGQVIVTNPAGSTGNIYVGSPTEAKASLAGVGKSLVPGESITIGNGKANVILDHVWLDADNNGQKVTAVCV